MEWKLHMEVQVSHTYNSARYPWNMSIDYSQSFRIAVPSDHKVKIPEQLIARIERYNQKDFQAIARGKKEREKWLLTKNKRKEHSPS